MAGSNTNAYPTHANTQKYCCATHVCTTQRQPCERGSEELVSPVVKIPLCCRDVPLHGVCVQTFHRSPRRWYAVRFEEGEEHAAAEKEEPRTSEEAHSRHPHHAAEMSCDKTQREKVCSSRTEGRSRRRTQTRQTTRAGSNSKGAKVPVQRRGERCIRRGIEIEGVRCALRGFLRTRVQFVAPFDLNAAV